MLNDDVPTWWKYLDSPNTPEYTELHYNVAMTSVSPDIIQGPTSMVEMWLYNISKRVDVIGKSARGLDIIEVTGRASIRTLGQIIAYDSLYQLTRPLLDPANPVIVCDYADPDVLFLCNQLAITIVEMTPVELQRILQEVFK